jgi:tetratricopeptide (TPR) repeat protein
VSFFLFSRFQFYTKCLESAQTAQDRRSEGLANYRLGRTLVLLDECHRAIAFLDESEAICRELGDREGEGQASAALASAYQVLQNHDKALACLKSCLETAVETGNFVAQGEACCALGVIYNERGDFDVGVGYFERNFEIARSTAAGGSADMARVYLGMARGNQMLKRYMHAIHHDPKGLLNWKAKRELGEPPKGK